MVFLGKDKFGEERLPIKCDCDSSCRQISFYPNKDEKEIYVSVLAEGSCVEYDLSLKQKLKQCFNIIFKNKVYTDNICLSDKEDIRKMANYFAQLYLVWKDEWETN